MEQFAFILPMLAFLVPFFIMFIIYAAILALIIWFIISFLNNQKERNRLLAEISAEMKWRDREEFPNNQEENTTADRESNVDVTEEI